MKYRIFDTEQEAIAAEAQVAAAIGCIKVGTNAKTGLPAPDAQATERWAVPQQITDGRWVFPSPDDTGVEADPSWFDAPLYAVVLPDGFDPASAALPSGYTLLSEIDHVQVEGVA